MKAIWVSHERIEPMPSISTGRYQNKSPEEGRLCHPAVVGGVVVLFLFLLLGGWSEQSPAEECPSLVGPGPDTSVSLVLTLKGDPLGSVCLRVSNQLQT